MAKDTGGGESRIALITGASSGIGAALARELARRGMTVGLVARRQDRLAEVLEDCRVHSPDSRMWVADLSTLDAAADLALAAWDAFGHLDILVNNAGVPMRKTIPNITAQDIERVMRINFLSSTAMTLALIPRMLARATGVIVNVASIAGRFGVTTEAAYSASKFAMCGWSEGIAADMAGTGVTVRLILPGTIDTELWDQPDNDPPLYQGDLVPAEETAIGIADAIDDEHFEHFLPDMKAVVEAKVADIDKFMSGMVTFHRSQQAAADTKAARVKALVFGAPPGDEETRPQATDDLERFLLSLPFGLHTVDDATMVGPDWVITRPLLSGICGSDAKLVMGDFGDGDIDNPMSAFSSLPHVPGHEVVAEVIEVGPRAEGVEVGDRVVLNPWLTCAPRGIDPPCPACAAGNLSLCWSFTSGKLGPGVHVGVTTDAPGAWAELLAAHDSMLIPVPDGLSDELAVLADPFAVSMHAILRNPPPPGGKALVYGAGALGATSVAALRCLYPDVEVAVVARFAAQEKLVTQLGAVKVVAHEPRLAVVEELAAWSGGVLHSPFDGLPVAHPGGIDVVYDTIAKPETFEVAVRVLAEHGTLVQTGVATPGRWEWTPVYFKELTIAGSNAFGIEEVEGVRQHAIAHYLDLARSGRVDLTGMLTHRFPLERWWDALGVLAHQDDSGAIKVAFEPQSAGRS